MRLMHVTITFLAVCLMTACSQEAVEEAGPELRGVSNNSLVVGQTVDFYFSGIDVEPDREYRLLFEGDFRTDDGDIERVQVSQKVIEDGLLENETDVMSALRLSRFGPFGNPFSTRGRPGKFVGNITLLEVEGSGEVTPLVESSELALEIEPSILIEKFQPIDTECGAPALRALPGLAYELHVRVTGHAPVKFTYEIGRANDKPLKVIEHEYEGPVATDSVGELEALIFNPIEVDEQFYVSSIRMIATDADGNTVENVLPISVHRPIEVIHDGKKFMAERYEPVPVSGCEPGTLGGRVSYAETKSEYRQHQVSLTVSRTFTNRQSISTAQSWADGIAEGDSLSRANGVSVDEGNSTSDDYGVSYGSEERNQVSLSTEDGVNYGWSRREGETDTDYEDRLNSIYGSGSIEGTVSSTAEGSVPGFAKASGTVGTTVGVEAGGRRSDGTGAARTRTNERGYGSNDSNREGRRFGSTTTDRRSEKMNGSYAVSANNQRQFEDRASRNRSQTWNFSGSISEGTVTSEGQSAAEEQTWSRSDRSDTTQSYSASLPYSKFGQFFRQTTRWVRFSEVRAYDQCGVATTVGELQFNDYTWAPDFAVANSCTEIETSLEPYSCMITPCNN